MGELHQKINLLWCDAVQDYCVKIFQVSKHWKLDSKKTAVNRATPTNAVDQVSIILHNKFQESF